MLNYTVPPFQFLVGSFDASEYLDSISLSVPMHEPGQALLWSGQFKISNNLSARLAGLTDADFSERSNPVRWRPYQQQVRLNIKGYPSPVFRIENYRYNPQTRTGEGILTQIPTAVAGDRPGVELGTTVSGTIGNAISKLLGAAFLGATVNPGRAIAGDAGVLDVPLTTRDGWGDAVRLSSLSWHWLTVDTSEVIRSVTNGGTIFTRTLDRVELVPDLAAIYQSAQKVIVTGARQVLDDGGDKAATSLPSTPRPKIKTTRERRPAGAIFPSLGASTTPTVFEEKTIIYQYYDDDKWSEYLPLFGNPLTSFLFDIQSVGQSGIDPFGEPPPDLNIPLQTITIKRQPTGFLFPSTGTVTTLVEGEVIVESFLRKLTLKPIGLLFPSEGTNSTLIVEKREDLTSALIPPGAQLTSVATAPDGTPKKYEPRPKLEPPQPVATKPLKTEILKGQSATSPIGWTPVLPNKPLVVDFGFLPDAARANFLATRIAAREQWRREQSLVDMPIPDEWLGAGWPLLASCQVGADVFLMDGCAISIEDGVAKFGFAGARMASYDLSPAGLPTGVPRPVFNIEIELEIDFIAEIEIIASLLIPATVTTIESSIEIELVPEIEVSAGIAATGSIEIDLTPEIDVTSQLAASASVEIELVPEIEIAASLIATTLVSIELIAEIEIASSVSGGGTFPIEGSGGAIQGSDGTPFNIEGAV